MTTGWRKPSQKAPRRLPEIRMVLMGETGSGKRSAANAILGSEEFLKGRKHYAVKRQREEAGRRVTVVNTPGWRRRSRAPGTLSPEHVRQEVAFGVSLCLPSLHALLLVVPVDSPFTPWHRRSVLDHLEPLTEGVWRHTLVLFTWGDALRHTTIEQHVARGGRELQWLVEKCGRRYHVLDGKNRGDRAQVEGLLAKIEDMAAAAGAGTSARYFTRELEGRCGQWERELGAADAEQRRKVEEGLAPRGPELQAELQHFVRGWLRKSLDPPPNVSGVPLAPGGRQKRREIAELRQERESQATPKERSQTPGGDSQTPPPLTGEGAAPETSPAETPPPSMLSKLRGVLEEMVQRDLEQREKLERDVASLREEWERERREKEERDREWRGGLEEELQREREERQRLERELEALREERSREREALREERDQRQRLEREMEGTREEQERERSEGEERRRALEEELRSEREGRERLERERSEGEERRRALEEELRSEREGRERLEREIADLREARERERSEREELRRRYEERARAEEAAHRNVLRQIRALAEQPSRADELP